MTKNIVIDTNVWVSYLISNKYIKLDEIIQSDNFQIFFSSQLLEELILTLNKPKLSKYIEQIDINNILNYIETNIEFITTKNNISICRDDKDNFLLSICYESNADYLVTGDKDLLVLKNTTTL